MFTLNGIEINFQYDGTTSICKLVDKATKTTIATGTTVLGKKDKFNKYKGRKIALLRALINAGIDKKTRFLYWQEYFKVTKVI